MYVAVAEVYFLFIKNFLSVRNKKSLVMVCTPCAFLLYCVLQFVYTLTGEMNN